MRAEINRGKWLAGDQSCRVAKTVISWINKPWNYVGAAQSVLLINPLNLKRSGLSLCYLCTWVVFALLKMGEGNWMVQDNTDFPETVVFFFLWGSNPIFKMHSAPTSQRDLIMQTANTDKYSLGRKWTVHKAEWTYFCKQKRCFHFSHILVFFWWFVI